MRKRRLSIDTNARRLAAARCAAPIGLTWREVIALWNGMEYQMGVGHLRWARYSRVMR